MSASPELDALRAANPRWKIDFSYGRWQAVHDNFEADWQGEEDGYVGNGWVAEGRDLVELAEEMAEVERVKNETR